MTPAADLVARMPHILEARGLTDASYELDFMDLTAYEHDICEYACAPNAVFLDQITAMPRAAGIGRILISVLCDTADDLGVTVILNPWAQTRGEGSLTQNQLEDWYMRHGFAWWRDHLMRRMPAGTTTHAFPKSNVSTKEQATDWIAKVTPMRDALKKATDFGHGDFTVGAYRVIVHDENDVDIQMTSIDFHHQNERILTIEIPRKATLDTPAKTALRATDLLLEACLARLRDEHTTEEDLADRCAPLLKGACTATDLQGSIKTYMPTPWSGTRFSGNQNKSALEKAAHLIGPHIPKTFKTWLSTSTKDAYIREVIFDLEPTSDPIEAIREVAAAMAIINKDTKEKKA